MTMHCTGYMYVYYTHVYIHVYTMSYTRTFIVSPHIEWESTFVHVYNIIYMLNLFAGGVWTSEYSRFQQWTEKDVCKYFTYPCAIHPELSYCIHVHVWGSHQLLAYTRVYMYNVYLCTKNDLIEVLLLHVCTSQPCLLCTRKCIEMQSHLQY